MPIPSDVNDPPRDPAPANEAPTLPPATEVASPLPTGQYAEAATLPPPSHNPAEAPTLAPTVTPADGALLATETFQVDITAGVLGPYRELQPVRAWKYGTVYSAVHPLLRRRVLLRILAPEYAGTPIAEQFLSTYRTVATIEHPHVATGVFEAAARGDAVFVAQEQFPGAPLTEFRPPDGPGLYPNRQLAQAVLDVANGLQAIHQAGMAHGHLSPDCLARGRNGRVCITGLGEEPPDAGGPAPDAEKDLADFGRAFAEVVTGRPLEPIGRRDRRALARGLCRQNAGLRRSLADILARCLTTDSKARFRTVTELANALEPLTRQELVRVGWVDRTVTQLYDVLFVGVPAIALTVCLNSIKPLGAADTGAVNTLFAFFAMYAGWEVAFGWTPGRRIRGLRLANRWGGPPRRVPVLLRCLLRLVVVVATIAVLVGTVGAVTDNKEFAGLAFGVAPVFAMIGLYLTSRRTRDRLPLHDYLTGVSWYGTRWLEEPVPLETVAATAPAAAPGDAAAGAVMGRMDQYEVRGLLGQGGMGAVYAAFDTTLHRRVALKVLTASLHGQPALVRRFQREARLAAQLGHPNVAQVFGFGQADGKPYLVMEFVPGQTLQQRVEKQGPLPVARAWDYLRQATLALREAAHSGIVHRDIKPSNLMLAPGDVVKVTDFGISRAIGDEDPDPAGPSARGSGSTSGSLTKTGALLGTPMYMSPEQARGEKLDHRSDIYSLGLTLYFLLSGRPPFDGDDMYDLVMRQCNEEPAALEDKVRDLTPGQAALLRRMIAKDREQRFPDYDALLAELDATAPRRPVLAGVAPRVAAEICNFLLFFIVLPVCIAIPLKIHSPGPDSAHAVWLLLPPPVLVFLTYLIGVGLWGVTPGKWLLRLRVVRPDGRRVGLGRAFVRYVALYPSWFWALINWAWVFAGLPARDGLGIVTAVSSVATILLIVAAMILIYWDRRHRALHDRLAGTVVVQLPKRPAARAKALTESPAGGGPTAGRTPSPP